MTSTARRSQLNFTILTATAAAALLLTTACGERTVSSQSDGSPQTDGALVADTSTPQPDGSTKPPTPGACVVAIHYPQCCPEILVVTEAQLAADPCIVRWPDPRPAKCPMVCRASCAAPQPDSRVAARGSDGVCRFADECQDANDCATASNLFSCCDCGDVFPKAFLAQHPCYSGDQAKCTTKCPPGSPMCDCAAPFGTPSCAVSNAFNRCELDRR